MTTCPDYLYYYQPAINIKQFTKIMLASIADKNNCTAIIPINYKEIIENILYSDIEKVIKFSKVIDIGLYYNNQSTWENKLTEEINSYLVENKNEDLVIKFTEEEIENIFFTYDEETLEIVDYFSELFTSQRDKEIKQNNKIITLPVKVAGY